MHINRHNNSALSIIEAVVYVAVFSLIIIAVFNFAYFSYKKQNYSLDYFSASSSARKALLELLTNIRSASYADNGAYPIEKFSDYEFIFYADTDNDNKVEKLRYLLQDGQLKKLVYESSGLPAVYSDSPVSEVVVARNIRNRIQGQVLFEYYDKNSNRIRNETDILKIVLVKLYIVSDSNPNRAPDAFFFEASASLRNLIEDYAK